MNIGEKSYMLYLYIFGELTFGLEFSCSALEICISVLSSIVVSFYKTTMSHAPFTLQSLHTREPGARWRRRAILLPARGVGPDLAAGSGVVPRFPVSFLGFPSGVAGGPTGPTDPLFTAIDTLARAIDGGRGA
jgi:hypothetical protein